MTPRPPVPARLIAWLMLRGELGEVVRGDLDEEYHHALSAGVPRRAANRRYWRQAIASIVVARRVSTDREGLMTATRSLFRSGLMSDIRYVVRRLRASPGFTAAAVMSLAIGIGANTAVASAARATLFEMLPVERPGELWFLFWVRLAALDGMYMDADTDPGTGQRIVSNVTYPAYKQLRSAMRNTASMGAFTYMPRTNVAIGNEPAVSAGSILADAAFFATLQPSMALGRFFTAADDGPGAEAVVISHDFWQRAAGGSPSILNASVSINGVPVQVIGVTSRGFRGLSPGGFRPTTDVTIPLSLQPRLVPSWTPTSGSLFTSVRTQWVRPLVRLPDGMSAAAFETRATAALRAHLTDTGIADAATAASVRAVLRPAGRGINLEEATTRRSVAILGGVVSIVLLIACLNLAGLMLARGVSRQHEFSVRAALGASRAQLVRLAFIESAILALMGASLGLVFLLVGRGALESMLVDGLGPMLGRIEIDASLLGLTALVAFAAATLAGLMPAVQWSRRRARLNLAHRPGNAGAARHPFGRALVAIQIAVAIPLLCGAGLLLRTMHNLTHVDLGFSPTSIVTFRVDPPALGPTAPASPVYGRILDELSRVPGVRSASMVENTLIAGVSSSRSALVNDQRRSLYVNAVGPDLFQMLGVRVLAGRVLEPRDASGPEKVVLNQTAADRLFGGAAIGRHFTIPAAPGLSGDRDVEVVGIVADTKYTSIRAATPPTMFDYYARRSVQTLTGMTFMVRVDGNPATLERPIREAVSRASKGVAATAYRTQGDQIDRTIGRERVFARLLTLFGGFALALAAVGLYGATAHSVARRTGEIGVRMALGAQRAQVQWLILRQVAVLAGIGLLFGVPAALFSGRLLNSLLFGLTSTDTVTVVAAGATMLAVVMIAGAMPARRAARIDPLTAIRTE